MVDSTHQSVRISHNHRLHRDPWDEGTWGVGRETERKKERQRQREGDHINEIIQHYSSNKSQLADANVYGNITTLHKSREC